MYMPGFNDYQSYPIRVIFSYNSVGPHPVELVVPWPPTDKSIISMT